MREFFDRLSLNGKMTAVVALHLLGFCIFGWSFVYLFRQFLAFYQKYPIVFKQSFLIWVAAILFSLTIVLFSQRVRNPIVWKVDHSLQFRPRRIWAKNTLFVIFFVLTVSFLKSLDVSWKDFNRTGFHMVAYNFFRLVLVFYLSMACVALGRFVLKVFGKPVGDGEKEGLGCLILCFFTGVSLYGILVTLLALLGYLNLWAMLSLTLPVLFYVPPSLGQPMTKFKKDIIDSFNGLERMNAIALGIVLFFLIWVAGMILLSRGLYPGTIENDVWEHYLPYYREVLRTGSVRPNEIWYHFYLSKGAGLFYMAGTLSDALSSSMVSFCFFTMTAAIVFQLIKDLSKDLLWAFSGALLFAACYDGSFFKHHTVFTAFTAFFIWGSIQLMGYEKDWIKSPLCAGMFISAFYIGFYQPIASSILLFFFIILSVMSYLKFMKYPHPFFSLSMIASLGVGITAALAVNYIFTGMAEMVPVQFFWQIADHNKFTRIFGASGLNFFILEQSALAWSKASEIYSFKEWAPALFRHYVFQNFFSPVVLLSIPLTAGLSLLGNKREPRGFASGSTLIIVLIFLVVASFMGALVRSTSTMHIFSFMTVPMAILWIMATKKSISILSDGVLKRTLSFIFLLMLFQLCFIQAAKNVGKDRIASMIKFISGKSSFSDALLETDKRFNRFIGLDIIRQIRDQIGPDTRMMILNYQPAPGYSFPGVGLVSEPTYTLGMHFDEMNAGDAERTKKLLQERQINYFLINPTNELFTSLTHNSIFSNENIARYFKIAFKSGNNYLLTWRNPEDIESLPLLLRQVFDR